MWEYCGMERSEEGLLKAIDLIRGLREEFWRNVRVLGAADTLNQSLEKAGRVADFLELGELMCIDALHRRESCGGHFRAESQTEDGEALRHDDEYLYVAAWEFEGGDGDGEMSAPVLHKEDLVYEAIELSSGATSDHPTKFYAPPSLRYFAGTPMNLTLKIWRQAGPRHTGGLVTYKVKDISPDMSFLEMLDVLNEQLNAAGRGAHRVRLATAARASAACAA